MSYVLQIWEQAEGCPAPASVEAADQLLSLLHDTSSSQNPKFVQLAQRLTARFPCICSPEAEKLPESKWAWSDGPLDGEAESAVFGLGLNSDMLDKVRPFVVQQAKSLGLNVMDEQAGEVFLADGKVLRQSGSSASSTAPERSGNDLPKRAALVQIIFERLTPFLAQHGFKARKSDRSFKCTFPNGWHVLDIGSTDLWPMEVKLCLNVESRFHEVTNLVNAIDWPDRPPDQVKLAFTTARGQPRWMDGEIRPFQDSDRGYVVRSSSEIDAVIEHLEMKLQTRLLPILAKYKTLAGLDEVLNPNPVTDSIFFGSFDDGAKHIITAYLARNPNLEQLCQEFLDQTARWPSDGSVIDATRKCIEYVRNQPQHNAAV